MSDPLTPGQVLGDTWELVRRLGRGGMGEVWQARHVRVEGKQAAIKALHSLDTASDELLQRFRREAEIAARLEHPNIIQIFDYAALPSGEPYLVMELLRGETLKERLARGPMPFEEVQQLVLQVGSALSVAHAQGVVHRDLKPENLFLVATPTGMLVKVLDFGISKLLGSNTLRTGNSVMIGTPMYMSPEQALGENDQLTPRSDVFSLATVTYQALSARPPFDEQSLVKVVQAIIHATPKPLPGLPAHAARALEAAFEKDPGARSSVEAFVEGFCGVSLSKPVISPGAAAATRAMPRGRGRRPAARWAWWIGVSSLLLAGGVGLGTWHWREGHAANGPVIEVPVTRDASVAIEEDAGPPPEGVAVTSPPTPEAPRQTGFQGPGSVGPTTNGTTKPEPPVTEEQLTALMALEAAFEAGRYAEVVADSQRPVMALVPRSIVLRGMAYCALGNLGLARATARQVPRAHLKDLQRFCAQHGIELN